jgi:hypothetical protein
MGICIVNAHLLVIYLLTQLAGREVTKNRIGWTRQITIAKSIKKMKSKQLFQRGNRFKLCDKTHRFIPLSNASVNPRSSYFFRERLKTAFLPRGYPDTGCSFSLIAVCKEYMRFSSWQFMHSVTGTITGTLGLQALLQAVGLSQVTQL